MTYHIPYALFLSALSGLAIAQDKQPAVADVQALQKKFQEERAEALDKKFPASTLAGADEQAKRAEEAAKAGNLSGALRMIRDARWQVPYVPTDLPPNIDRVLGIARMRHGDIVTAVAYSPSGEKIATASGRHVLDKTSKAAVVKIWDLGNGREVKTYPGSKDPVKSVAWSPDGKWIASTAGNEIHIWDPETGKLKKSLTGHEKPVSALAFHPDSNVLASGSDDMSVPLWDIEKGAETANLNADADKKAKAQIYSVAFSPNGKLVAAVNDNGLMQIWNPSLDKAKRLVSGLDAHASSTAYQVVFGKDTSVIFTSGSDYVAKQWIGLGPDGEHLPGHGRPTKIEGHTNTVTALAITKDGKFLATGGTDKTIRLWDLTPGVARLARVFQGHSEEVSSLAFSPDGKTLATSSDRAYVRLWDFATGDPLLRFAGTDPDSYVSALTFSPDGKLVATGASEMSFPKWHKVWLWDVATGHPVAALDGHQGSVTSVAFSRDGRALASGSTDRTVQIWDVATGKTMRALEGHDDSVDSIAFAHGGSVLASGSKDGSVRLWNAASGAPLLVLRAIESKRAGYAFTPDNSAVEFLGDDPAAVRQYPVCRVGPRTFPFELCAGRFEIPGLMPAVLHGDGLDEVL